MPISIEKRKRVYFPESFEIEDWPGLEKAFREMLEESIDSSEALERFIEKCGELSHLLAEAGAWKTIRMTQYADNLELSEAQAKFYKDVIAPSQPYFFKLNKKIFESGYFKDLPQDRYAHLGKILRNEIEIYREENIPLFVEENRLASRYGEIYSQLTVIFEGKEKTLKEMELLLKDKDRQRREGAWRLIWQKMLEKREKFEKLFDELKALRIRIAQNAGFDNYRDYIHKAYGRFDYTPKDLLEFHDSIEAVVLPALAERNERRREKLKVDTLRPWDLSVDLDGKILRPFADTNELLAGSIRMLGRLDPVFADTLSGMAENDLLDLPNRKGKAPGGYSCPLPASGTDFIFMNAVGIHTDVQTLLHESGHALHAFALQGEKIAEYSNPPSEVAELASMSMELFILDMLDEFYQDKEDIKKAKREQLEDSLAIFPMVASIDAIQHWIYLHPEHSWEERDGEFGRLKDRFNAGIDWTGLEKEKSCIWLKTLHIFEIPFYYAEYAIAQLGAIALYRQYKQDPAQAIANYKNFMKLGYSKSVPEIYAAAGIRFDFSKEYLKEMVDFVMEELESLD
jgi:oligoendopeptidase F